MIPVDGPIKQALSYFLQTVEVKDATYARNSETGVDEQTVVTRSIKGAVDPSGGRNFNVEFGGSASDGDIAIISECVLFIDDNYSPSSRVPQSFVKYQGWWYRINGIANWLPQAGVYGYRATRHVTQDTI